MSKKTMLRLVRQYANERNTTALGLTSRVDMGNLCEEAGVSAEIMFALCYGLPFNQNPKGQRDQGYDYEVNGYKIDTKGSAKANNLLVPIAKDHLADLYIQYLYLPKTGYSIPLGWEWREVMLNQPIRDFGYGEAHYKPVAQLKGMLELHLLL